MLDIRFIRENAGLVQQNAKNKGYDVSISRLLELDEQKRSSQKQIDELREARNNNAAKMKGGRPAPELIEEGKRIKSELAAIEEVGKTVDTEYITLLKQVPNMAHADVPVGATEDENVETKRVGELPELSFVPKNHYELAEAKDWLDKERAAKVAGSRFAYIKGDMVQLQQAIITWVMSELTNREVIAKLIRENDLDLPDTPFTPVLPPLMIKTEPYDQMDRLEPRDDRYKIEGEELWLQGSAEHVLGSMHAGEIFEKNNLPLRYLGFATSFRREAGTYGKDMEGIIRMHQFDKLEMESFTPAELGHDEHLLFVAIQEYLLSKLELPYRVLLKCTADIGKPNARGVDMEVWIPTQEKYRETHTADYMTDYQARRLNTRVRQNGETSLIHTNDATAFALGRAMVAILENYQTEEGDVRVPAVLQPFLGRNVLQ